MYLLMSLPLYGLVFALAKGAALGLSGIRGWQSRSRSWLQANFL